MTEATACGAVDRHVRNAPSRWMKANGLPTKGIPDDAELHVDEQAGTITVEVLATDDAGRSLFHAGRMMTRVEVFSLVVPPPAGLLEAYQYTVARLRRERGAAEALRRETADEILARIRRSSQVAVERGESAVWAAGRLSACHDVFDALGLPRPVGIPDSSTEVVVGS